MTDWYEYGRRFMRDEWAAVEAEERRFDPTLLIMVGPMLAAPVLVLILLAVR